MTETPKWFSELVDRVHETADWQCSNHVDVAVECDMLERAELVDLIGCLIDRCENAC